MLKQNLVSAMALDAMARYVTRASASVVLTMQKENEISLSTRKLQTHCHVMIENIYKHITIKIANMSEYMVSCRQKNTQTLFKFTMKFDE